MSGCVNCVWDVFREDLEEWAAANTRAQKALKRQSGGVLLSMVPGGRDVIAGPSLWEGLDDIPIGIRVFMDTEKAIKSRNSQKSKASSAFHVGE
ncbi:hypothetical protein TWF173_001067 [Orbilia oligospora]|uniref:Oxidoreductase-like domain-containing protein n=1 Tax=Orbilia oligospora TaxID=2813651 RepID=A0A7C8VG16_ORBOL|nr:hypothetical protein TWF970_005299 [Orbilia oligospora]KAF3308600.1 hypothetical protein TWF173_001067 [Orbilia oligospora]